MYRVRLLRRPLVRQVPRLQRVRLAGRGGARRSERRAAEARAAPRRRLDRRGEADRAPGVPELDRVLGGGLVPASLVLVGGEPGVGKSTLLLMALRAMSATRRVLLISGEESVAQVNLRAARLGGAEAIEILAETELDAVCATLERERPDVCVIDSVQTLYSRELGSAPGSVGQVRRGRRPAPARREGERRRHDPRRSRDEGRRRRRAARPRAPRRLRAPVRGRPVPRPPRPPRGEEPLRLDERARRLRDDGRGPRRRAGSVRALRPHDAGRDRRRRRVRARGDAPDPARDPVARRADRSRDAAPRRHRRRPEAAGDDRRGLLPARRARARQRRRLRQRRRRPAGSTSRAPTSRSHSRSRPRRRTPRCAKGWSRSARSG